MNDKPKRIELGGKVKTRKKPQRVGVVIGVPGLRQWEVEFGDKSIETFNSNCLLSIEYAQRVNRFTGNVVDIISESSANIERTQNHNEANVTINNIPPDRSEFIVPAIENAVAVPPDSAENAVAANTSTDTQNISIIVEGNDNAPINTNFSGSTNEMDELNGDCPNFLEDIDNLNFENLNNQHLMEEVIPELSTYEANWLLYESEKKLLIEQEQTFQKKKIKQHIPGRL